MMKCYECGCEIAESARACPRCGAVQYMGDPGAPFEERRLNLARGLADTGEISKAFRVARETESNHPDIMAILVFGVLTREDGGEITNRLGKGDPLMVLETLAEKGCARAYAYLSACYGGSYEFLEYDSRKSREYMWYASAGGFVPAMPEVGDMLAKAGSPLSAYRQYLKAARAGFEKGIWKVVLSYFYGRGVHPSYGAAAEWAAKLGDSFRFKRLWEAMDLKHGVSSRLANPYAALTILEEVVGKCGPYDCPEAYYECGTSHLSGFSKQLDKKKGLGYLRSAVMAGMPEAMLRLSSHYRIGGVVKSDPKKSYRLWRKAVELGSGQAMYKGTHPDPAIEGKPVSARERRTLLLRASEGGNWQATRDLILDAAD